MMKTMRNLNGRMGSSPRTYRYVLYTLVVGVLSVLVLGSAVAGSERLRHKLSGFLLQQLTLPEASRQGSVPGKVPQGMTVMYVLGGGQNSQIIKYETVASLYHSGLTHKVIIMHVPGITEYDVNLNRNLTNDEWSIKQFTNLGLDPRDITILYMPKGFFGTLTEARGVTAYAAKNGIRRLVLVCSSYHAHRVKVTFGEQLKPTGVAMEIHPAREDMRLLVLLDEYAKIILYEYVLLPGLRFSASVRP
jgi:hypothetical protein